MDKVYNIDEIFGSKNVKVQALLVDKACIGCYFLRNSSCFKPEFVGTCRDNGQNFIFIKIN